MLKQGIWMAIGQKQNVIVKVEGECPFIRIIKGISMNEFFCYGRVKELDEKSSEIQHILQNPEEYSFEPLTVSEAVNNVIALGTTSFEKCDTVSEEDIRGLVDAYQTHLKIWGTDFDSKFIITLCKKYNINIGQARNLLENKIKRILNFNFI